MMPQILVNVCFDQGCPVCGGLVISDGSGDECLDCDWWAAIEEKSP